jgi:hypothetical protein
MTGRRLSAGLAAAIFSALAADQSAQAQWHASVLALRTNGSVLRPGDCVRLDLLSLDAVPGPITTRVTFRYTEAVTVKDSDGKERTTTRGATREQPAGPLLDALAPLQWMPLDDSLCFGEGTLPGAYLVEVVLRPSASGAPFATLRTCVVFDNAEATSPAGAALAAGAAQPTGTADCSLLIRGVKRAESGGTIYFEGNFPASGLYKAALVRNNRIDALLEAGVYQTGPHELVITSPALQQAAGGDIDLVILDGETGASTTLGRFAVPRGN